MKKHILITIIFWGMFPSTLLLAQNINQTPKSDDFSPSAKAIWSTLLTGQYSPEILQWHVQQRKKILVQRPQSMNQRVETYNVTPNGFFKSTGQAQYKEGWRNFEQESTFSKTNNIPVNQRPQSFPGNENKSSSEYAQMIRRMEFSLSPKNIATNSTNQQLVRPSTSSVLAKLVLGRSNEELKQWKTDYSQLAYQQSQQNDPIFPNQNNSFAFPSQTNYIAVLIPANSQLINIPANQLLAGNENNSLILKSSDISNTFDDERNLSQNEMSIQNDSVIRHEKTSSTIVPVSVSSNENQSAMNASPALYIQPVVDSSQKDLITENVPSYSNDRFFDDGLINRPQKMKVYRPKETVNASLPSVALPLSTATQKQDQRITQPDQNGWSNQKE